MSTEEQKQQIMDAVLKKTKTKTKFYFSDLAKMLPEEKPRAVKKLVNELVNEGKLVYWSSGSTTMYGLPGVGKQAASEGESKE